MWAVFAKRHASVISPLKSVAAAPSLTKDVSMRPTVAPSFAALFFRRHPSALGRHSAALLLATTVSIGHATDAWAQEEAPSSAPPVVTPAPPVSDSLPPASAPAVPEMSPEEVAVRVTLNRLVDAAKAKDEATFRTLLSAAFVDVVGRYQALVADAPESVRANYTWDAFMRTFAREDPKITAVAIKDGRATAEVVRGGNVGRLLFVKTAGDVWKLDVQPALAAKVAEEEAKRATVVAPDDPVAEAPSAAASQPASASVGAASQPAKQWPAPATGHVAVAPMPSPAPGPFDPGQPLHYVWYTPDYLFIAGAATVQLLDGYSLLREGLQSSGVPSLIGPSFRLDDPDLEGLGDPRLDAVIGRPFLAEKVSGLDAALFGVGTLGVLAVSDVRHLDFHHTHAFVVGGLTASLGAMAAAETGKAVIRRLRPDFRERYTRAACGDLVDRPEGLDCGSVSDGFQVTRDELNEGFKSFPSAHSSFSFAVATYGALYLGGEYIWGQDAGIVATPLAALGVTGLYSVAAFMSASRLSDNKHHVEDVAVGSVLGAGIAAATYFLHFDLDGNARWRGFNVSPVAYDEGGGVSLSGRF